MIKLFIPDIGIEELEAVIKVLESKWLVHGPEVEAFEEEFAEYVGTKYAIAVSNGTIALFLVLKAFGIKPGDEVLVPDFTFIATATAPMLAGARPIFIDINPRTYNMDPNDVLNKITPRTKAVVAVHLYGYPAEMKALREICEDKKLILIEDAAQAHGARYKGRTVGSLGDAAAFSFYATKNMTTGGEGGIITTDNKYVAEKLRMLRNHGQLRKYYHVELGWNFRMTALQAAIGRVQLRKLERIIKVRRRNASRLKSELEQLNWVRLPYEDPNNRHVYHLFTIWIEDTAPLTRDELIEYLKKWGIETGVYYPIPLHEQPLFKELGYKKCCPNAEEASKHVLSIPVHQKLSDDDLATIVRAFKSLKPL